MYLVREKNTNLFFAIKKISKFNVKMKNCQELVQTEIKIQYSLNHPNIIKTYGIFDDEDYVYIIMEYLPNKTLYHFIEELKDKKLA